MDGKYTVLTPIDNTVDFTASALNFQGGQYKKIGDKSIEKLCESIYDDEYRKDFDAIQAHQKYPVPWKTCPYPAGPNEIFDYFIEDFGSVLPPYIPGSEKWKFEIRLFRENEVLGGYNIFVIIRSEKSLLGY